MTRIGPNSISRTETERPMSDSHQAWAWPHRGKDVNAKGDEDGVDPRSYQDTAKERSKNFTAKPCMDEMDRHRHGGENVWGLKWII
jgi:hypothetical protein